ncbi:ABC transporter-like [Syntrophomonas zehnderi OL-4]|uniref:ABC transporter-like n=1 Tax=Syntrophomonas zehnderi OL-4 TaxID=690567 RepID=A0A0E3W333_9FIRM|nr:ATP-binding cassette domain-containing protein [Syntrophomonas zehnderi]CFX45205.1 ABC transporter-like [Syntrophomonas zehnderi OL-4]
MIKHITILGGFDKNGNQEKISELKVCSGEVLAVVGPTGSGKTQLISDIEQYAEEETLTGRKILINGQPVDKPGKKSLSRLVAQVSQNMNFVIDLSIKDFLLMHARVRGISNPEQILPELLYVTNLLSGEPVTLTTNLAQLSGGQSRALMVADVAIISNAPVVLIDEIENAGIDRLQALKILTGQGKIVLVVSHDPTLMLMSKQRVVMKNGGMDKICQTTELEKRVLKDLIGLEEQVASLRERLRQGENLGAEDGIKADVEEKERRILWQEYRYTSL